jgi:hypothetical protein
MLANYHENEIPPNFAELYKSPSDLDSRCFAAYKLIQGMRQQTINLGSFKMLRKFIKIWCKGKHINKIFNLLLIINLNFD